MGGGEDALVVFVVQREPSVPASTLLQDLHHIPKLQAQVGVGLVWAKGEDDWEGEGRIWSPLLYYVHIV